MSESEKLLCQICGEEAEKDKTVKCASCKSIFHRECIITNDNMLSWKCDKCKLLSVPPAPRSNRSKSIRSQASSTNSQRLALQRLEEEKKLLQQSVNEKLRLEKEFLQQSVDEQLRIDKEFLAKKYVILEDGSRASGSEMSSSEKVRNWIGGVTVSSTNPPAMSSTFYEPITTSVVIVSTSSYESANIENLTQGLARTTPGLGVTVSSNITPISSTKVNISSTSKHPTFQVSAGMSSLNQNARNSVSFRNPTQFPSMTTTETTNHHDISRSAIAARQVVPKELPTFTGKPSEWPEFIAAFNFTTEVCEISEYENAGRLQKCLSGIAFDAVRHTLYLPGGASNAIETLRRLFGQPEFIVNELLDQLRRSKKPKQDDIDSIILFSLNVENLCASMKKATLTQHLCNPVLMQELTNYLPSNLLYEWAQYKYLQENINVDTFAIWLKERTDALLSILPRAPLQYQNDKNNEHLNLHVQSTQNSCLTCGKECSSIISCAHFNGASLSERWELVKTNNICRTCLKRHRGPCLVKEKCGVNDCQYRHHKLLHNYQRNSSTSNQQEETVNLHKEVRQKTLFKILPVTLSMNSKHITTFAILDDCSSITLMEQSLSDELGLSGNIVPLFLKWTGETTRTEDASKLVCVDISGEASSKKFRLDRVRTVTNLNLPMQTQNPEDLQKYEHLRKLPIPTFCNAVPRMLIGLAHAKLLSTSKLRIGKDDQPIAAKTPLGWVVYGGVGAQSNRVLHINEIASNEILDGELRNYFSLESLGVSAKHNDILSVEESRAKDIMQKTTKFKGTFYETGLLWKYERVNLPRSFEMAKSRHKLLERKLQRDPNLHENVQNQINDYLRKGYARILSPDEVTANEDQCWYLPVFLVHNSNKPDKLRLVWDAAAKVQNVCLNSVLLKGPDLLTALPGILRRFRERRVAVTGDIREMFHQVRVRQEDQNFQRFLWRFKPDEEPRILAMNVMTFGASCSPACANYVLNLNASRFKSQYPEAVRSIKVSHYVDDLLECRDSKEDAIKIAKEVKFVHEQGGFEIRNWASNDKDVLRALNNDSSNGEKSVELQMESCAIEKVLGLWWDTSDDTFTFLLKNNKANMSILDGSEVPTKREILRTLMSIFDPLGLLSHILIYPKILLQDVWRAGTSWDEPIPKPLYDQWKLWVCNLKKIELLRIPRSYGIWNESEIELHTFVDASEEAFACVIYARICTNEAVKCVLLASKSKVAPLKPVSMPRLELQAALIGARMAAAVKEEQTFKIVQEFYWSDSETVLSWIRSDARRYKQFVSVRIGEILELTQTPQWRWVPTKLNIADSATRKVISSIDSESSWFVGPHFLYGSHSEWPENKFKKMEMEEIRSQFLTEEVYFHDECTVNTTSRTNWIRVKRAQAYVFRFVHNCKVKAKLIEDESRFGPLLRCELVAAEQILFIKSQYEGFQEEVACLINQKHISKTSPIYKDSPFIDDSGLMRSNSRLANAPGISDSTKKPIILPKGHEITELLLYFYHTKYHHINGETAVNEVRQLFIVPTLRVMMKKIAFKCQYCKNKRAKANTPYMANLPRARVSSFTAPFSFVGIDYFGPMSVKVRRSTEKRWGVIITCLTVRAIHIELASSLTTDACILCLQRFIARRGMPLEFYSDNGKNLRGAAKELKIAVKSINQLALAEKFNSVSTEWFFNPPSAPHMGGSWERLIRSIKITLSEVLPTRTPTEELLTTMMCEVEDIINSRPLTYVPVESELEEALTPNHFLKGSSDGKKPMGEFSTDVWLLRNNWKKCEEYANRIWKKWRLVYLPDLRRRHCFNEHFPNLKVGDVTILCDDNLPRNHWPKAIVLATYPSQDGRVRRVTIRTAKGIYDRPASKLARLDVQPSVSTTTEGVEVPGGLLRNPLATATEVTTEANPFEVSTDQSVITDSI